MTATGTTTTVVVPGTHLMAALVGPRDQHLRQIEEAFPMAEISVRGNEVNVRGEQADKAGQYHSGAPILRLSVARRGLNRR